MDRSKKITGLSILVLAQIMMFIIVYFAIILLGIGLIYLLFHTSIWIIPPFLENIAPRILGMGRLGIIVLIAILVGIVGLWTFVFAVGIYLVKPLFIFPKQDRNYGKELHRCDSPQLYDLIMDTAMAAGVKKPKHIYINHGVNACVFFNTSFWNIFFPVRKNLAIGLGLFESTNKEEVRSIIAHEFGHFAQSSMRVGSALYVANKFITDLVYRRDKLDVLMVQWSLKGGIWGFWGTVTQSIVIKIRSMVEKMYRSQQRNYMKLSRQMEYDADAVSCRIVGTNTFISALCKVQQLDKSFGFYNMFIDTLVSNNQTILDYWKGYSLACPRMLEMDMKLSTYDKQETTPEKEGAKSRVTIEEIWESHPPIEKRIEQAQRLNLETDGSHQDIAATELVDAKLKNLISYGLLQQIKEKNNLVQPLDWNEYENLMEKQIEKQIFPKEVVDFFNRDLFIDIEGEMSIEEEPLTDNNKKIILDYEQAIQDKQLLLLLSRKDIPVKRFLYDGEEYLIDDVPLEIHNQYILELKQKVENIDASIKRLALTKAEDKEYILVAYSAIDYAQKIIAEMKEDFLPVREDMIKELNSTNIAGEGDLDSLREWLDSYESTLKEKLRILKYPQIVPFMAKDEYNHIVNYLDASRMFVTGIRGDAVNYMFAITDWIVRVHENLVQRAKMTIINTILDRKLDDIKFLELWMENKQDE